MNQKLFSTPDSHKIVDKTFLQLWNEEAYHQGPNKGFWIEICFFDFNRFEIRIVRAPTNNLELESCKQSDSSLLHYIYGKKINFIFLIVMIFAK